MSSTPGTAPKVLVVKMSSMGDIIHTLPALTDAQQALPGVCFDWVVEEAFAEIPAWHPSVNSVIAVAFRRWRKTPLSARVRDEWRAARAAITREQYDQVIDAQGLLKSALVTRMARGRRCGMDRKSAREGLAAFACDNKIPITRNLHAVERTRMLFAAALDYPLPTLRGHFGIAEAVKQDSTMNRSCVWFLHGTARPEKCWPEQYWLQLARQVIAGGNTIALTWGDEEERGRAQRIAKHCTADFGEDAVRIFSGASLAELAGELSSAKAVVTVDTGLGHLAAALSIPTISLYGPTDPALVSTYGPRQVHLRARAPGRASPMSGLLVSEVWRALQPLLSQAYAPDALRAHDPGQQAAESVGQQGGMRV